MSKPVKFNDVESWLECVWDALQSHRDVTIPEGKGDNDAQWDEICTAMAWIREELPCPNEDNN